MKKTKKLISLFLALLIVMSVTLVGTTTVLAADTTISYSFSKAVAGYAQGTITVTSTTDTAATYYLYWADDVKALEGYQEIGTISTAAGQGSLTMPNNTVIPADATRVLAFKATTEPAESSLTVANATAEYAIPASQQLPFSSEDALYTFGAISDPQLANDSYGSNSYPYDEVHLEAAFETLRQRGVDFTISSGDTVNDQNGNQTYLQEYRTYQSILADSGYIKPLYEAIGNHDVGTVWNKNGNYYNDNEPFIMGTGLDSTAETINAGLPYYEITEPTTGDHFIFMALEGGFYTNKGVQFSDEQLDWLEGLLEKYSTDGKNIFIIEHANITGWGSGDKLTEPYYYDLALEKNNADVSRFVELMETYKDCVIITGHTHLELSAQYNYSDNDGTSAVMMHNSAIGGVRRLVNGTVDRTAVKGLSEGYIVEVYEDCILFNGTNMYYNETMPQCCYIVPMGTSLLSPTVNPTEPDTEPTETSEPTQSTEPTPTATDEIKPSDPSDHTPEYIYGDADLNGTVNVKDATAVQKYAASIITLDEVALVQANVTGDAAVNVRDATAIQKFIAGIIGIFPVEENKDMAETGAVAPEFQQALDYLEEYYIYSSYDQYMALKYDCHQGYIDDPDKSMKDSLQHFEDKLVEIVAAIGGTTENRNLGEITVYFSNNKNWSNVYAYVWGSGGTVKSWPGTAMTLVGTNSLGEEIYSFTVDYQQQQNIIFTNNSGAQTQDIAIVARDNVGYYISGGSSSSYTCETYDYSY